MVLGASNGFITPANEQRVDQGYSGPPGVLLLVTWTTVAEFLDQTPTQPQPEHLEVSLAASGHVTLARETAMRTIAEWTRYYPPAEAENLFDSIIPTIEQFELGDLRARRENYVVHFYYQTTEGERTHDCLLADLTPITSLLVSLRLGGANREPERRPEVQQWARDRFKIFPPEQ